MNLLVLLTGAFFLAFGLAAYRHFYTVLGGAAGTALWAALRHTVAGMPGLREHPGTANTLLLAFLVLGGMLLARKFRRALAFAGGFGTGVILSMAVASFMGGGPFPVRFSPAGISPMDLLAGLVGGVAFLFFERVFAVLLTSAVGAFLCSWAVGSRWTFPACLILGLVAQPLVSMRFRPPRSGDGSDRTGTGTVVTGLFVLILSFPTAALADWVVDRVHSATSRVVIAAGWRDGVRQGERYAVLGKGDEPVAVITVTEIFSDSSYADANPAEQAALVRPGMAVVLLEEHEFQKAMTKGSELLLQAFLDRYPSSRHGQEVAAALDEARFRKVQMDATADAYRQFQRQYPTSRFGGEARRREELLTFERTMEIGTEEAFGDFLRRFPRSSVLSGMAEARAFLRAREAGKVYAYEEFMALYPKSGLAGEFGGAVEEFRTWAEKLEFGKDPVEAIRFFGQLGDETAVPLLIGKLLVPPLEEEAREAIFQIGQPALGILMEVLISPLQSLQLKDKAALMIGELGDISAIPAMRTYVEAEGTAAGREALMVLEEKVGR